MQQLTSLGVGVRNQSNPQILRCSPQQMPDQRRLASADFAGDHGDRGESRKAVFQHRVGPGVDGRPEQEIRIRQKAERPPAKPKVLRIDQKAARGRSTDGSQRRCCLCPIERIFGGGINNHTHRGYIGICSGPRRARWSFLRVHARRCPPPEASSNSAATTKITQSTFGTNAMTSSLESIGGRSKIIHADRN